MLGAGVQTFAPFSYKQMKNDGQFYVMVGFKNLSQVD